jgi:imidazolonepropionase-like amidohydrolase
LKVTEMLNLNSKGGFGNVLIKAGKIICASAGSCLEAESALKYSDTTVIDLHGGAVSPGLLSFGSPLGLQDITSEPSTNDGVVFDPLVMPIPSIIGNETAAIRAVDGLQFATRDAL